MPWSCLGPGAGELPDCGPVNKFSMQILHTAQIFQLANSQWCSLLLHKVSWIFFLSPHQFECGPTPEHFKRNKKYAVIVWPMCIIIYCLRNRSAFLQYWLQFRQYLILKTYPKLPLMSELIFQHTLHIKIAIQLILNCLEDYYCCSPVY